MRIGVDLGGTKIEIAAFAPGDVRPLVRRRVPSPAHDYAAIVETIVALIEDVERELGARGTVGIGTPGSASPRTGMMRNANSTVLIGRPFQRDVEVRLGRAVRVANDADCFVLSEATDGAAANARIVFGAILGTGVGGGIAIDGRLLAGPSGIAGEWGHNPLPWTAPGETAHPCYCGKRGCIETYLSGPALARDHAAHGGAEASAADVARAARAGSPVAVATLERYASRLARALASVTNVLDPDVIVLGGGVSNVPDVYERVPALWSAYVFSDTVETRIVRAAHGDSSGVRGAAWLWPPS